MKKVVIVGGVAGGASAAARLRRLKEDYEIIVLERGPYVSFANCGLPYYIGHVIKEQRKLELMTPRSFLARFNIDVRINHEAKAIDKEKKEIQIRALENNKDYTLNYDYLVLSPGAMPIIPQFKIIDKVPMFSLRTIPDAAEIKEYIENTKIAHATIIGGGFIGLEMAENLRGRGINVKIVEMLDQVMPALDKEMAQFIHQELILNGVCLGLDDAIESLGRTQNNRYYVKTKKGKVTETDLIILSIGIMPETKIAKDAGLDIAPKGHIIVNDSMITSDPSIYAVGDAVLIKQYQTQKSTAIPLAGPANKQGRIAADNIAGRESTYKGALGASVVKIFDLTVANVGLSEKQLKETEVQYEKIYLHPNNHAGYYPGATPIAFKLLFQVPSGKVLGAQAIGGSGTEKRIDVISTVIKFNGTVFDLEELELTYAPPFGSAKDPINMAGFIASNVLKGDMPIWHWDEIEKIKEKNGYILDVRTSKEHEVGKIEGSVNISDMSLRDHLEELPKDRPIYIYCAVGFRGYLATRLLMQKGFKNVSNLTGGYRLYEIAKATTEEIAAACGAPSQIVVELLKTKTTESDEFIVVDASGLACPGPLNALVNTLETAPENKKIKIYATDPGFKSSVEAYAKLTEGVELLHLGKEEGKIVATLQKGEPIFNKISEIIQPKKKSRKNSRGPNASPTSEMSVEELYNRLGSEDPPALLVDVRTPQEYTGVGGHIKEAKSIPLGELMDNLNMLDKHQDEEIVLICHSGARSRMAARLLAQAGFKDLRNLTGGMMMWHRKGY